MNDLGSLEQLLVRLFDTPGYQWLVVLVAIGAGAAHALAPGHGKSIAAAYLVGAHGRAVHAVWLGFVVAAMHTVSAVALALLWQGLRSVLPWEFAEVTAGLQVAAALVVVAVGVSLVRRRHGHGHAHTHVHEHEAVHAHAHAHADAHGHARAHTHVEPHAHSHAHGHTHGHTHTDPDANPFTRKGLLALGTSGGLVPSPTVFLILVSGLVTGRVGFAVLLVALFGLGMMVTIAGVGVLTLRGLALAEGGAAARPGLARAAALLPRVAAWVVLALGLSYLALGLRSLLLA